MNPTIFWLLVLCHAVFAQDASAVYSATGNQPEAYASNHADQYSAPAPAYKSADSYAMGYGPPGGYDGYAMAAAGADYFLPPYPPFSRVPPQIAYGIQSLLRQPFVQDLPKGLLKVVFHIGLWVFAFSAILLIGGGFTVALCSLTHLCTLHFHGGHHFSRESVTETMRGFLTPDRISAATSFVTDAVRKYRKLQDNPTKEMLGTFNEFARMSPYWKQEKSKSSEKGEKKTVTKATKPEITTTTTTTTTSTTESPK